MHLTDSVGRLVHMRALIPITAALIAAAALASAAWADTSRIRVGDNYFVRPSTQAPTVHVRRGDTVWWAFTGRSPHNVTARGPEPFRAKTQVSGDFKKKLNRTGTYRIYCTIHGERDMSMILQVKR
jgi:plastocyanin